MTVVEKSTQSPMMLQWAECKKQAKDALLLFQMGEFYEAFHDDALCVAKELDIALTQRQGIPMSGVPLHTSESYFDKLIAKGYRVAIAEQIGDPKTTKGLVKREIVRIISSGTVLQSSLLSETTNNYFVCLAKAGNLFGLAVLDLTTAEFRVIELETEGELLNELYRLQPKEFLTSKRLFAKQKELLKEMGLTLGALINTHDDWHFEHQSASHTLKSNFSIHTLDSFGLKGMTAAINAAGALVNYLKDYRCLSLDHIQSVTRYTTAQYMMIDRATQKHLELTEPLNKEGKNHTLLHILDKTETPMGARMMRHLIKRPLLSPEAIRCRQEAIQAFIDQPKLQEEVRERLCSVRDLERVTMRISAGYATPRDLVALRLSLEPIPRIKRALQALSSKSPLISEREKALYPLDTLTVLIAQALVPSPPAKVGDGKLFIEGYSKELDELYTISLNNKEWLTAYQEKLRATTGIKTLKVGFNRAFGYFIEVSKGQAKQMPSLFMRRQTLTNSERFLSEELKEYEEKILGAEEKIQRIESKLFLQLRLKVAAFSQQILNNAKTLAFIDCIHSLADVAKTYNYTCPTVDDSSILTIKEGRHPVIECAVGTGEPFIPNDTHLNDSDQRMLIITGPNMAGKSTYIRQVALLTILAQIGAFIPAKSAHIGIVDQLFSRIGASDDLARGQSTFMVEMTETATILHHATSRSLVILDEVGRGTSTYDGISIAWSIAEYLLNTEGKQAKTLFATHYWELTELEKATSGAVNYNVAIQETEKGILFLRKIVRGGTDKSYGIHVAELAGLPISVIQRAKEILQQLETGKSP